MAVSSAFACNGGMRLPPAVHVELHPSRVAGAAIGALALVTLAVLFALPLPAWQQSAGTVAVAGWAWLAFGRVALRRGVRTVTALTLAHNRMVIASLGDGTRVAGHVRGATFVGSLVTSIVWRPDGARWSRAVLVLPDMLPAEDFRRLRVLLRYARSDVAQGDPASQA
jgi:hypothetical protein